MTREIVVDLFAGGGGASTGIEQALGIPVAVAVNHDPDAILMHKTNHPDTTHYCESVWAVDPVAACAGRPVGLLWASPDCKHFSKAKGAAPVSKNIRGLAWVVLRWAAKVRPRMIILENVEEFVTWGPVRRGKPIKSRKGMTFAQWRGQLMGLGYAVEHRELVAADFGAPTSRKRFFLIARCDGQPIAWPEATHSKTGTDGKPKWRSAAEIIDWSLPCPSIFDSRAEIKAKHGLQAVRPLADNTMKRIARGVDKFVLRTGEPFVVELQHQNEGFSTGDPLHTVKTVNHQYLCTPALMSIGQTGGGDRNRAITEPVHTAVSKAEACIIAPHLLQYHTEKAGEYVRGQCFEGPIMTVDGANRYGLAAAYMTEYYGNADGGYPLDGPTRTATGHDRNGLSVAFLSKYFAGGYNGAGHSPSEPMPTVTAIDHNAIVAANIAKFYGASTGQPAGEPLHTITAGQGHFGEVRTHLVRWDGLQDLGRWSQVRDMLNRYCGYEIPDDCVLLLGLAGALWFISDIGLRMLIPRELYAANGFPESYIIDRDYLGNVYPKDKQVARCGNAVPPPFARALVSANWPEGKQAGRPTREAIDRDYPLFDVGGV